MDDVASTIGRQNIPQNTDLPDSVATDHYETVIKMEPIELETDLSSRCTHEYQKEVVETPTSNGKCVGSSTPILNPDSQHMSNIVSDDVKPVVSKSGIDQEIGEMSETVEMKIEPVNQTSHFVPDQTYTLFPVPFGADSRSSLNYTNTSDSHIFAYKATCNVALKKESDTKQPELTQDYICKSVLDTKNELDKPQETETPDSHANHYLENVVIKQEPVETATDTECHPVKKGQIIIPILNPDVKQVPNAVLVSNPRKDVYQEKKILMSVVRSKVKAETAQTIDFAPITMASGVDVGLTGRVVRAILPPLESKRQTMPKSFEHLNKRLLDQRKVRLSKQKTCVGFKCDICGKSYQLKNSLHWHKRHSHSKGIKCHVCKKLFGSKCLLKKHLVSHGFDKVFSCSSCNKTFVSSRQLRYHTKTHTMEKGFQCVFCLKQFSTKSLLEGHVTFHMDSNVHKCQVCKKVLMGGAAVKAHVTQHLSDLSNVKYESEIHIEENDNFDSYVLESEVQTNAFFKCDKCGEKFVKVFQLQTHLAKHNGTTIFTCGLCERQFLSSEDRNKHLETHKRTATFCCCICNMKFCAFSSLQDHVASHD